MALTKTDALNYRGELFLSGQNKTPFLNAIYGRSMRSSSFVFPMAQPWALAGASQPAITEDASVVAGTPTTTTRSEATNTAQIFKYDVAVSFKKQSQFGLMSGINTSQPNPVTDELTFQKMAQLRQMAIDMEYSFLNGTYAAATNTATAAKTRGIVPGTTTNAVAASSAQLSRPLIDSLLRTMAANGSPFNTPAILVNAYQKQKLSTLYEYGPQSRNEGGSNIQLIETDFGIFKVMYVPQMPTDTLLIAELSSCYPVFVPVNFSEGDGMTDSMEGVDVLWQPTAVTAAARGGFVYAQAGLSYSAEVEHGKITGLATA
jgi:hypothetical protein